LIKKYIGSPTIQSTESTTPILSQPLMILLSASDDALGARAR
jgi:hypothetical protein